MFAPTDFFDLAHELSSTGQNPVTSRLRNARVRTAFGRTYYGLYLLVRAAIAARHGTASRCAGSGTATSTRISRARNCGWMRGRLGVISSICTNFAGKRDYEMEPRGVWEEKLADSALATMTVAEARRFANTIPALDFTPVVHLFR